MDNFKEEVVVRKSGKAFTVIMKIVVWVFIVLFGIVAMAYLTSIMGMNFSVQNFLMLAMFGGAAVFMYVYKDNLSTEYEYSFTNGEIDFAKVLGNKRRKPLMTLRLREVEAGGHVDSPSFEKYIAMSDTKKIEYYLNPKEDLYFLYFVREGKKQILVFEPSQVFIDMMCQYSRVLER